MIKVMVTAMSPDLESLMSLLSDRLEAGFRDYC